LAGALVCAVALVAVWRPWDSSHGWRAAGRIERPRPHNLTSAPACGWAVDPKQTMRVVICRAAGGYRCYYASPGRSVNDEAWWIDSRYADELSQAECTAAERVLVRSPDIPGLG
jgi:hypothetical protein